MLCGSETAKTGTKQSEVCVSKRERVGGIPKGKQDERRQTRREVVFRFGRTFSRTRA